MIECTYTREFWVDEWNRPDPHLSLADVPIKGKKILTRPGYLVGESTLHPDGIKYQRVQDKELKREYLIPDIDVKWEK